jgi:regulatory protein
MFVIVCYHSEPCNCRAVYFGLNGLGQGEKQGECVGEYCLHHKTCHAKTCKESAIQLLARRDHSEAELFHKLLMKGFAESDVSHVIQNCRELGYLDDVRYTEFIIRHHLTKGHGEQRIRQVLRQKQVADEVVSAQLRCIEIDWFELAKSTAIQKFGQPCAVEPKEYAKRVRHLQYRGFSLEQIQYALKFD